MKQTDLDFINFHKTSKDETKLTAKKLQKIYNSFQPIENQNDNCMCKASDRREFKIEFYIFWNNIQNDIKI